MMHVFACALVGSSSGCVLIWACSWVGACAGHTPQGKDVPQGAVSSCGVKIAESDAGVLAGVLAGALTGAAVLQAS